MKYSTRYDLSVTFKFKDEITASKIAAKYNVDENHDNFAMQKRDSVCFLGKHFKERALEEFSPETFGKGAVERAS